MKLKIKSSGVPDALPMATDLMEQKRSVLIVDDERLLLEMLGQLLGARYEIRLAQSGAQALDIMREGFYPEVILADQRMPGMSGSQFLAASTDIVPKAVHIVLTGYTDVADIVESINLGHVYLFLTKPWDNTALLHSLDAAFHQHDLMAQNLELRNAMQALQLSHRELERLNTEKSDLMRIVAHDLKNPIGAMVNYAELLASPKMTSEDGRKISERIAETGTSVLDLIHRMLDVEAIEAGKVEMRPVNVDVGVMMGLVKELFEVAAERKNITLHLECEPRTTVQADEKLMNQVLENLLSNAVKYSPFNKNVWVRVVKRDAGTTTSDCEQTLSSKAVIRIEVRDEGPGVSEADKKRLFEKFSRLTARPTNGELSTGLGLAIAKKFVELMNGCVWCETELGNGAAFIVELPAVMLAE